MSDEAPAGFEEPLLETRQGPVLDGHGENEPAQEIAEVVGDHPEEQPHLIGPEPVTGEAGLVGFLNTSGLKTRADRSAACAQPRTIELSRTEYSKHEGQPRRGLPG